MDYTKKLSETDFADNITGTEFIPFFENKNNGYFRLSKLKTFITKQDIGLGNADNTADIDKPISTLTQQALNGKANLSHTHNYSDVENLNVYIDSLVDPKLTWNNIKDKPLQFIPVAHSHEVSDINQLSTLLASKSDVSHTHSPEDLEINVKVVMNPVLDDYARLNHNHTSAHITDFSSAVIATVQPSLDNKSDTNHTHIEFSNLVSSVGGKADAAHTHEIIEVVGLSSAISNINTALSGKSNTDHTHTLGELTGLDAKADAIHSHEISEVNGLSTALSGKSNIDHTHPVSSINGFNIEVNVMLEPIIESIDGKASLLHTHDISDINGLDNIDGIVKIANGTFTQAVKGTDYITKDDRNIFTATQTPSINERVQPSSGTVTWDLNVTQVFRIDLNSNITNFVIQNLTLDKLGTNLQVVIMNNSGTITWGSNFSWVDGTPGEVTGSPGIFDVFVFLVETTNGSTLKLLNIGSTKNIG